MSLNKDQINRVVNSLEWLCIVASKTGTCTLDKASIEAYLDVIKELAEDNEAQGETITNLIETIKSIQADTVQKYHEKIENLVDHYIVVTYAHNNQIAKEMLEGSDDEQR